MRAFRDPPDTATTRAQGEVWLTPRILPPLGMAEGTCVIHLVQIVPSAAARCRVDLGVVLFRQFGEESICCEPAPSSSTPRASQNWTLPRLQQETCRDFLRAFFCALLFPSRRRKRDAIVWPRGNSRCDNCVRQASRRFDSYICAGRQRRALGQPIVWISKA